MLLLLLTTYEQQGTYVHTPHLPISHFAGSATQSSLAHKMGGFDSSPAMTRPSDLQESQLSGIPFVPLYMPFNNHSNFDLDKDFKSSGVGFVEYFLTEDDAAQCTLPSEFLAVEGPLPFLQINNTLSAKCGYSKTLPNN